MQKVVKVATWNIGSLYADYSRNVQYMEQILKEHDTDVLCMQEVPKQESVLQQIAKCGGFSQYLFRTTSVSHVHEGHDMGIAVFSKFPIASLDTVNLSKPTVPVSYRGKPEVWHDKLFWAVSCQIGIEKVIFVTGHGFPFHRYGLENPENRHIIAPPFKELDCWLDGLSSRFSMQLFCMAADFNLHDPLPFLPRISQCYQDVFYNTPTRPSGRKTDAVLISKEMPVAETVNLQPPEYNGKAVLDHNFIGAALHLR